MSKQNPNTNDGQEAWPLIFAYTREQAIADGVLVDLTDWARETGFRIPVACTSSVWDGYVTPPPGSEVLGQCERGRGHDLLWMLYLACRRSGGSSMLTYQVIFVLPDGVGGFEPRTVALKAVIGPGDEGEPVLTVMLPSED